MVKQWKRSLSQSDILSDGQPFDGANVDAPISSAGWSPDSRIIDTLEDGVRPTESLDDPSAGDTISVERTIVSGSGTISINPFSKTLWNIKSRLWHGNTSYDPLDVDDFTLELVVDGVSKISEGPIAVSVDSSRWRDSTENLSSDIPYGSEIPFSDSVVVRASATAQESFEEPDIQSPLEIGVEVDFGDTITEVLLND